MLVIKAYVNYDQIDEIHIQNVGEEGEFHKYLIRQPECDEVILHKRSDGWIPLGIKILKKLEEQGYDNRKIEK